VDEAHFVSLWGGTFRNDYTELGVLRGCLPANVSVLVASATLLSHVLDDVCAKLKIAKDHVAVRVSNARPNVALSVSVMKHPEESKADLRFIVPPNTTSPLDIPVQLVYCNGRITTEDVVDHLRKWLPKGVTYSSVAFYHAKIGTKRKRELEEGLRIGIIRILVCTDAVGMLSDCAGVRVFTVTKPTEDVRNVERVVLWGTYSL
jgi:superfamily II DNA helicase RecQ